MVSKSTHFILFGRLLSVVVISLFGLSALAAEKIKRELVVTENTRIQFFNLRGDVEFKGWQQSALTIEGVLDEESTGLLIEESENNVLIKVKMPHQISPENGSKLVIRLPKLAAIEAQGVSTNWIFTEVGSTSIHSISGAIELKKGFGDVSVDVVSAAVLAHSIQGNLNVTSLSGKIEVSDIEGEVELSTVEGELHFKQPIIKRARLSSINGQIHIEGALSNKGNLAANSVDGDVFLKIGTSENLNCTFSALYGGDIKNYLKVAGKENNDFPGKHFSLVVGDGGAVVEATTISGTIHLQD